MRLRSLIFALAASAAIPAFAARAESVPSWLPGIWQMTDDEDNGPLGELVEFTPDGHYFFYGKECLSMSPITFHVHDGDIYVTNTIPNKGPVSVIFHPVNGHGELTFTSPRTFNSATYSKTALTSCQKQS